MADEGHTATSVPPSAGRAPSPAQTPLGPVQPDHFYPPGSDPSSSTRSNLSPEDDPLATRGIPVFRPSMDDFADFEQYMTRIEPWGMASGIVKVIPPREWTAALPDIHPQLGALRIRKPIEQLMLGQSGVFRAQNIEKRRDMTMRDWAEMCMQEDFRAPAVHEVGLKSAGENHTPAPKKSRKRRRKDDGELEEAEVLVKDEVEDDASLAPEMIADTQNASPHTTPDPPELEHHDDEKTTPDPSASTDNSGDAETVAERRRKRREAMKEESARLNEEFLESFDPHSAWLPPGTAASDYTPAFCSTLERRYWRNVGFGRSAWYGADCPGSLFPSPLDPPCWNVGNLPSALTRLLPRSAAGVPGVNTPYLYFGMWRATFAWHVEDMDLFSINYIHFGAPKFWYAFPQGRAAQLENMLASHFPGDAKLCRQFLRHKSFLASPSRLAQSSHKPNTLVQHAGEFVITYPRGYHAGFNLGLNCAESVNFALDSWLELGKKAQACGCVGDSVHINVEALLRDRREEEEAAASAAASSSTMRDEADDLPDGEASGSDKLSPKKRKHIDNSDKASPRKRRKDKLQVEGNAPVSSSSAIPKVLLKISNPPRKVKVREEPFPCCLCVSRSHNGLLRVHSRPRGKSGCANVPWKEKDEDGTEKIVWRAHEYCARVVPETWVDEWTHENASIEKMVFGVDSIVRDRWHLKCAFCRKPRDKAHGAPIQCTKGKCPKAFHISCALFLRSGNNDGDGEATNGEEKEEREEGMARKEARLSFRELREVDKEVFLSEEPSAPPTSSQGSDHALSSPISPDEPALASAAAAASITAAEMASEKDKVFVPYAVLAPFVLPDPNSDEPQLTQEELDEIKLVKKIEYELYCSKHNPIVMAEKRQNRYTSTLQTLSSLPPLSRIYVRTSHGVFEVCLCSVDEEKGTVEVLWDEGQRKVFASTSVVMKSESVVGSKPSVAPPDWYVPVNHSRAPPPATTTGTATPATSSTTPFINTVSLPALPSDGSPQLSMETSSSTPALTQIQAHTPGYVPEQATDVQHLMALRVCAVPQGDATRSVTPATAPAAQQPLDIETIDANDTSSSSSSGVSTPPAFAIDPSVADQGQVKVTLQEIEMDDDSRGAVAY